MTEQNSISTGSRTQRATRVQFVDDEATSSVMVACETSHPGGMMAPLVSGLSELQLEVHKVESRINDGIRSERLWVVTADGEPLGAHRRGQLRTAVFTAMEQVANHSQEQQELSAG